jgi:hypothetical protein
VFGREESGLTEAELRLCAHACAIPTGRMQASMNLSHAVSVVLSGLFERRLGLLGFTENPGLDIKGVLARRVRVMPTDSQGMGIAARRVTDPWYDPVGRAAMRVRASLPDATLGTNVRVVHSASTEQQPLRQKGCGAAFETTTCYQHARRSDKPNIAMDLPALQVPSPPRRGRPYSLLQLLRSRLCWPRFQLWLRLWV